MTLILKIESQFFAWHSCLWWCTTIPSLVMKCYIQTLSRLGTNICHERYIPHQRELSILWWNNTPHTAQKEVKHCCRKSADVDSYVRVGRKSTVLAEIVRLFARTTCVTTHTHTHTHTHYCYCPISGGVVGCYCPTSGSDVCCYCPTSDGDVCCYCPTSGSDVCCYCPTSGSDVCCYCHTSDGDVCCYCPTSDGDVCCYCHTSDGDVCCYCHTSDGDIFCYCLTLHDSGASCWSLFWLIPFVCHWIFFSGHKICQTAYLEHKRISSICMLLSEDAAKALFTSCNLSRLDYVNCLSWVHLNLSSNLFPKILNCCMARSLGTSPPPLNTSAGKNQLYWLPIS